MADPELHNHQSILISPNIPEQVPGLVEKVSSLGKTVDLNNAKERSALLEAVRSLMYALETPREAMSRQCWATNTCLAAIESGIGMGLWEALAKDDRPKTVAELAEETGADALLVGRLMKHLCAMGTIIETGPNEYRRTGFAQTMAIKRFADSYPCTANCFNQAILAIPAYLKRIQYRNPSNPKDCPFQAGNRTYQLFFEYLSSNPDIARQFNNHMGVYHQGRPSWMDFYDVRSLYTGVGPDDVLIVDMGGNIGHDLSEFKRKWSDAPGRLILQDLPEVIEHAKESNLPSYIEPMAHNFFTEQPVKGARAYFMHSVLHDWRDDVCHDILRKLAPAMKRGYSKLLINENVISETEASWEITSVDMILMALLAAQERTATQWHELLESAGYKITKIWTDTKGAESLIECELA